MARRDKAGPVERIQVKTAPVEGVIPLTEIFDRLCATLANEAERARRDHKCDDATTATLANLSRLADDMYGELRALDDRGHRFGGE